MINIVYLLRKERRELKIIASIVLGLYGSFMNLSLVKNLGIPAMIMAMLLTCTCTYTVLTICELPYIFMWFDENRVIKVIVSILSGILLPLVWIYVFLLPLIEILSTSSLSMLPVFLIGFLIYGAGIFFDIALHVYMKKRG